MCQWFVTGWFGQNKTIEIIHIVLDIANLKALTSTRLNKCLNIEMDKTLPFTDIGMQNTLR